MVRLFTAAALLGLMVCAAFAASLDPASINSAEFHARTSNGIDAGVVKVQVLLDRARFSPGEIDGKLAENTQKALTAFAEANGLTFQKSLTQELWDRLAGASQDPVIVQYTVAEGDVKGPFLKKLPARMDDMKAIKVLAYTSPREAIAEKFHMSEALLAALNPRSRFDRAGEVISVANVAVQRPKLAIARIEVDKARQTVKALDRDGALLAYFPATVGSEEKPTPTGSLKVVSIDANPTYRYNPAYRFKGVRSKSTFTINPGPNNPVGLYWIGLSAEGYGIHGTPTPSKISKSESHGCVRLTNWDVALLAAGVRKGTPVDFVEGKVADGRS